MNEIDTIRIPRVTIYPNRNHNIKRDIPKHAHNSTVSIFDKLVNELGEDVFIYLHKMGATNDENIILISPIRHYLYSSSELKFVKTVINTREINDTRQIKRFLRNFNRVLNMKCYFVGKFTDYKDKKEQVKEEFPIIISHALLFIHTLNHKIIPKIPILNWIQYLYNGRKFKYLTSKKVKQLMTQNGFHLIDIKQINGVSYFVAQKVQHLSKVRNSSFFNFVNDLNTPY